MNVFKNRMAFGFGKKSENYVIEQYAAMRSESAGAKFHSQAVLSLNGAAVPDFICLTAEAFELAVKSIRPQLREVLAPLQATDRKTIATAANTVRQLINALPLPGELVKSVETAIERRLLGAERYSVRACMIGKRAGEGEDSITNPFAGISDSFLYVKREDIWNKIRACWASAFSERAILYRLTQNMDPVEVAVAVGVQRMIFGKRSWVMFTCNPNTAARDTVLVAGFGIGEGVVQESVPVDHYFVNAKSSTIQREIADKSIALEFDAELGAGVREAPVPLSERLSQCLSDDEIHQLRALGQRIETLFGWPQDIEGTIDADGKVHVLQARPIALDFNAKRVWTGLNVTESYPGVSTPLTYSVAKLFYRVIFADLYRRTGVSRERVADNFFTLDRMIGYVGGRIYYSLNAFYLLHHMSPLFPWLSKAWENMVGLKTSYFIASGEPTPKPSKWQSRWDIAVAIGRVIRSFIHHPRDIRAYKRWWIERARQSRAIIQTESDALALSEEFYRLRRDVGRTWGVTLMNDAYIFTLYALSSGLLKRWGLDRDPAMLSNLLCGDDQVESVEIFRSVLRIADDIRADATARQQFLDADDAELVRLYRERLLSSEVLSQLDRHIELYGDRSMEELKIENPSLREDPSVLLRGVRRFVRSPLDSGRSEQAEMSQRAQAEQAIDKRFGRFSLRASVLRFLLNHLREVIAHRENSRYCRSELFGLCKEIFRKQGAYLASRGVIDRADDVYFLNIEQVLGFADGTGVDEDFKAIVASRRRQHADYLQMEIEETLTTNGGLRNNTLTRSAASPLLDSNELRGLGSSMGVATGRARVVLDPNTVEELPADSILVAKETDPGWLFLMLASRGMVVERGSMLSHTAITGRKFGIPTVVGVDRATVRIPDGANIDIDGGSGVVKVL
jgi:phosphohistidine swiveling domain-containing protein